MSMIFGVLFVAIGVLLYQSMIMLHVVRYTVTHEKISEPVRLVFLSDLHCRNFGKHNATLRSLIAEQEPDAIALVGDMLSRNSGEEQINELCSFIKSVVEIAPVYYALGNHEEDYISANGANILKKIEETGAVLLENEYSDVRIRGQSLRIGGTIGLVYQSVEQEKDKKTFFFLSDFCDTSRFKIMLNHRPEGFYFGDACAVWDVDLILSGHTHGGLIKIPFIGGMYAPMQGFLPKVYYGEYRFGNNMMIITSGLAGHGWVPRVNNPPEIAVVELVPQTNS